MDDAVGARKNERTPDRTSSISRINQSLDEELQKFGTNKLEEEYPYLFWTRKTRRSARME